MRNEQTVVLSFYLPQKEETLAHIETVSTGTETPKIFVLVEC
jgi:hypothetical protein